MLFSHLLRELLMQRYQPIHDVFNHHEKPCKEHINPDILSIPSPHPHQAKMPLHNPHHRPKLESPHPILLASSSQKLSLPDDSTWEESHSTYTNWRFASHDGLLNDSSLTFAYEVLRMWIKRQRRGTEIYVDPQSEDVNSSCSRRMRGEETEELRMRRHWREECERRRDVNARTSLSAKHYRAIHLNKMAPRTSEQVMGPTGQARTALISELSAGTVSRCRRLRSNIMTRPPPSTQDHDEARGLGCRCPHSL